MHSRIHASTLLLFEYEEVKFYQIYKKGEEGGGERWGGFD